MGSIALWWRYASASIRAQMAYKVSFYMTTLGAFLTSATEFSGIWALFTRFGQLPGWSLAEVCVLYGVVNITFAISDAMALGFDLFGTRYVRTGQFDRLLLRPRGVVLQLLGHELTLRRLGRLSQGVLVLLYGLWATGVGLDVPALLLMVFAVVGGVCLFLGLFMLQATLSFWSVESLEVMNTLTYGGVEAGQYPLSIYEDWFRSFFLYIVPLGCVTYLPVVGMLGLDDPLGSAAWMQWLAPSAGIVFLLVARALFLRVGVRHYTSTGS